MPDRDDETPETGVERIHIGAVDRGPRMRAWMAHDVMRRIEDFQAGAGDRLRATVPPVALESLARTGRLEWISINHGREFSTGAYHVLGEEDATRFFRWMLPVQLDRPVLRSIVRASIAVFGLSPLILMRAAVSSWPLAFLEVAQPRVQPVAATEAVLLLSDICDDLMNAPVFLQSIGASFSGYFDICRTPGQLDLAIDQVQRTAAYHFRW